MRVLLDEYLPRRLKARLVGHQCATVPEMGWAGKRNGELLRLAEGHFDVFITADRNLSFQQNVAGREIGVVVLVAPTNTMESFIPLVPELLAVPPTLQPRTVVRVGKRTGNG